MEQEMGTSKGKPAPGQAGIAAPGRGGHRCRHITLCGCTQRGGCGVGEAAANQHWALTTGGCAPMDKAKAVTAAAHKLVRLFSALRTKGQEYVDQGQQCYEERYRQRFITQLQWRAQSLGMALVPTT
jgi:hypothetical protein